VLHSWNPHRTLSSRIALGLQPKAWVIRRHRILYEGKTPVALSGGRERIADLVRHSPTSRYSA
jgi:hypothetical protein